MDFIDRLKKDCVLFGAVQNYILHGSIYSSDKLDSVKKLKGIASGIKITDDEQQRRIYHAVCMGCVNRANCKLIQYVHRSVKNAIINDFGNGEREIIFFPDGLKCIDEVVNADIDHSRNYVEIDGILFPKEDNMANAVFLENTANSLRQSTDAFWGYALSNKWDYFITLTTDKRKVDRFDDDEVKALWRACRQRLQRFDPNVKILLLPERHKNGALHFHGLVAMEKQFTLRLHMIDGKQQYSATGAPLFEFPFWDFGIASCAIISSSEYVFKGERLAEAIDESGNVRTTSQRRVVAYLSKYMGKEFGQLGYNKKHFYRTRNVVGKDKSVDNYKAEDLLQNIGAVVEKQDEGAEEPYKVDFNDSSEYYMYKQDSRRIIFRTRIETREQREVMGVLVFAESGMEYRALGELEKMAADGLAELIGENCQYKYFKEIAK